MDKDLLWFDADPKRSLVEKVHQAAARYQVKFGQPPTICYLNEQDFNGAIVEVDDVQLRLVTHVRSNYFWIGVDTDEASSYHRG